MPSRSDVARGLSSPGVGVHVVVGWDGGEGEWPTVWQVIMAAATGTVCCFCQEELGRASIPRVVVLWGVDGQTLS